MLNKENKKKTRIEKFELDEGVQPYHLPLRAPKGGAVLTTLAGGQRDLEGP